ncbi:hypothetical protein ASPWEDRAFT_119623 [Aspergillus wentii DTO 134E9]|uniref:Rhodopsin domain-containing protein n=1 Tax=Aspergillus wentii DTO 134E9 TaxID=1073089 RepID=A0A1L9R8G4_ASPWE|nr:uncharacterized protein ASPWEDRAFT_119623 [Aspergillus wentii DTO 134E9]KAI9925028.1 hypothetical protein MW887_006435 [Aspergillus wentii]OJJ31201.1 hypothetical protein ASPWEDRAFT_119623 [Aspergillus wentii DTO 134E9]
MGATARGREMICIISVLVGLSLICVIMRVLARVKRRVPFGMDDYLCFLSITLLLAMLIELILWCTIGGDGAHKDSLDMETLMNFSKIFLANQFTYFILCPAIKISIICFYRRLFSTRTFQWATLGLNTLIATWGVGIFLACALQCRPLKGYWDKSIDGHCFNQNTFFIVNQVFNILMDFIILGLPIPMIWNLQRAWQDKLALNGVFALGAFVCFASIYRVVVLFWISDSDPTYTVYQATLWTHIEPAIGLICSCLPVIRGLFPKIKLTPTRKYATAPYYINTDVSTSHFAVSSPKSPASEYYKMEDGLVSRGSDKDSTTKPTHLGPMDITIRTDIDVTQDAASMRSMRSHT